MPHTVLIIEDEATLARNMTLYLRRQGYTTTAVESGEAGLAELPTLRPDLVLLDYHLPHMNGLEVLVHLRHQAPRVKTIMLTGQGNREVAARALAAGVDAYVAKPLALSELKRLVDGALGAVA